MQNSIAIFWDIENVTPSESSLFVNGLLEYAQGQGKISIATAYGDWNKPAIRKTAASLAENSFELIHVPRSKKNSTDMTLTTNAIETIHKYSHITSVILVAGDSDFRALLQNFRRHALHTIVICDAKSASEDLLELADDYKDFRDLIPDTEEESDSEKGSRSVLSLDEAFNLLREAIEIMKKNRKKSYSGAVKIRMKLLNENFDERRLGCRSWRDFIMKAEEKGEITIDQTDKDLILSLGKDKSKAAVNSAQPFVFEALEKAVHTVSRNRPDGWVPFAAVSNLLIDQKIDLKRSGYPKFKRLIQAAEKRGIVETRNSGLKWDVRLVHPK